MQWSRQRFRHGIYPLIIFTPTSVTLGVGYKGGYPSHPFFCFDWKTLAAKDDSRLHRTFSCRRDAKAEPLLAAQAALPGTTRVCAVPAPGWACILVPPRTFQVLDFTHIFCKAKPILCDVCYSFCPRVKFFSNGDLVSRKQKSQR